MAKENDITLYRGEDVVIPFVNVQTPIGGWSIQLTVRTKKVQSPIGTPTTEPAVLGPITATITDAAAGKYQFLIPSLQTLLQATTYYYDVQRTDPGACAVLSIGSFTVLADVRQ